MAVRNVFLDVVRDDNSGGLIAIALSHDVCVDDEPTADWPPDPRHANQAAVEGSIEELSAKVHEPTAWFCRVEQPTESAFSRVQDLLRWSLWQATATNSTIDTVYVTEHACDRSPVAGIMQLPSRPEIKSTVAQVVDSSKRIGLGECAEHTRIVTFAYGIPRTPVGGALARHVAVLCLSDAPPVWCLTAPTAAVAGVPDQLARAASTTAPDGMGIVRLHSALLCQDSATRAVAKPLASAALEVTRTTYAALRGSLRESGMRAILGGLESIVDSRHGDYEACEQLLRALWDRANSDVPSVAEQAFSEAPWSLARAHMVRGHVANHRGDWRRAKAALRRALTATKAEDSIRMQLLALDVTTLMAVSAQNCWPFDTASAEAQSTMSEAAKWLTARIAHFTKELLINDKGDSDEPAADHLNLGELGAEATDVRRDPVLGRALGTLGRTQAFLGEHDEAIRTLLAARGRFASAHDRRLNTVFMAHVELDRETPSDERFGLCLDRLVDEHERGPAYFLDRIQSGDDSVRFLLNLLLKALCRGVTVGGAGLDTWRDALASRNDQSFLPILSRRRSHPTEMLARHAGELLATTDLPMASRWYELSIEIGTAGGSAMARMATFTRLLANTGTVATGDPRGSILNPCYEYR